MGWLTVISPSAHDAHHARRLRGHRGAHQRRAARRAATRPGPVDVHEPVVGDLLAGVQRPDDLDALEQARLPLRLGWPAVAGDVLVDRLARPSATQNRPGNMAARVAEAWAMIAGW